MKKIHYLWAFIYGIYLYLAQQILFLIRFQRLNLEFSPLDLWLYVVGVLSVMFFLFFQIKLKVDKRYSFFIAFIISALLSVFTSLMGGLLGAIGIVLWGLMPFLIILPVTYLVLKK